MRFAELVQTRASRRRMAFFVLTSWVIAQLPMSRAVEIEPLGLCPVETNRLDGFMRTICEGEGALKSGRHVDAVAKFRQATQQQRLQATNELAWAGLAAAYCKGRDLKRGREWAARFDEARRLWLGELDCGASATAAARRPQPFVRDHMCVESLTSDYSLVKKNPQAPVSLEITARFADIAGRIEKHCAVASASTSASAQGKKPPARKQAKKKPRKQVSERAALPARGR